MNLILVESEENIQNILKTKLLSKNNQIVSLVSWKDLELANYEAIYLFSIIENNFVDYNVQEFILKCNAKVNIITISKKKNNDEPFISWINSLIFDYSLSLNISLRLLLDELDSNLELVNEIINNKRQIKPENNVVIYTDGACSGNPGAGGWGVVLINGDRKKEVSGYEPLTTNNKMELTAVVRALSMLKKKCNVELYSDSAYVVNAINQNWLTNWKRNGWKNSDREQVKNIELWQELDVLLNYHSVTFNKVKGHSDNEFNNRCDELATSEIAKNRICDN